MTDSSQEGVPLSHALGNGTMGQLPRARPSLKALAARVLENAREPVPLSHALETGTVGQAVARSPRAPSRYTWDAEDWHAFLDERAGIAEHDGGLKRADAERQAFECCISEWHWRNPPLASGPERCAHCSKPLAGPGRDGLPFLTGDGGHTWLHSGCHGDWMDQRRAEAVTALEGLGLTPPESTEADAPTEAHQTCPEHGPK